LHGEFNRRDAACRVSLDSDQISCDGNHCLTMHINLKSGRDAIQKSISDRDGTSCKMGYRSAGWYFVTICTRYKICSFGSVIHGKVSLSPAGVIADRELTTLAEHYEDRWVDTAVVMPNHIHALILFDGLHRYSPEAKALQPLSGPALGDVVGGYKAGVSRICHRQDIQGFQWQSRFHDRILGSNTAVDAVRRYIRENPKNWPRDPYNPGTIRLERAASRVASDTRL